MGIKILTVTSAEELVNCIICSEKTEQEGVFAKCKKCEATVKYDPLRKRKMARVIIREGETEHHVTHVLQGLLGECTEEDRTERLLSLGRVRMVVDTNKVACSAQLDLRILTGVTLAPLLSLTAT